MHPTLGDQADPDLARLGRSIQARQILSLVDVLETAEVRRDLEHGHVLATREDLSRAHVSL